MRWLVAGAAVAVAWALRRERAIERRAFRMDVERRIYERERLRLLEGYAAVQKDWRAYAGEHAPPTAGGWS